MGTLTFGVDAELEVDRYIGRDLTFPFFPVSVGGTDEQCCL